MSHVTHHKFLLRGLFATSLHLILSKESVCEQQQVRQARYVVVGGRSVAGKSAIKTLLDNKVHPDQIIAVDDVNTGERLSQLQTNTDVKVIENRITNMNINNRELIFADGSRIQCGSLLLTKIDTTPKYSYGGELGELEPYISPSMDLNDPRFYVYDLAEYNGADDGADPHSAFGVGVGDGNNSKNIDGDGDGDGDGKYTGISDLLQKVSVGKHVTLVGGASTDFAAIDLSVKLAVYAQRHGYSNCVTVLCPSAGVLSYKIPRFISLAINKRLRSMGVELVPFAQVRYVDSCSADDTPQPQPQSQSQSQSQPQSQPQSSDDDADVDVNGGGDSDSDKDNQKLRSYGKDLNSQLLPLSIFSGHSYDTLRTISFQTDFLVYLNNPSRAVSSTNVEQVQATVNNFAVAAGLEVSPLGGFVANRHLQSAAGVYVAGNLASVYLGNPNIGRCSYEGYDYNVMTGHIAALNMLADNEKNGSGVYHAYSFPPVNAGSVCNAAIHVGLVGKSKIVAGIFSLSVPLFC